MSDSEKIAPRRWWIAAILALLGGGVAYVYVGRPKRAAVWLAAVLFTIAVAFVSQNFQISFAAFLIGKYLSLIVLIDAIRISVGSQEYRAKWFNRWWLYFGLLVVLLVGNVLAYSTGPLRSLRPFSASSSAMLPTLLQDERFLADKHAFDSVEPHRGDLVVFRAARDGKTFDWVKRIVGLPGDRVAVVGDELSINGVVVVSEPTGKAFLGSNGEELITMRETLPGGTGHEIAHRKADPSSIADFQEHTVPADHYFVLGDNRDISVDSRLTIDRGGFGDIPRSALTGKPVLIPWSSDWRRIGRELE